jgi:hypothetical protein
MGSGEGACVSPISAHLTLTDLTAHETHPPIPAMVDPSKQTHRGMASSSSSPEGPGAAAAGYSFALLIIDPQVRLVWYPACPCAPINHYINRFTRWLFFDLPTNQNQSMSPSGRLSRWGLPGRGRRGCGRRAHRRLHPSPPRPHHGDLRDARHAPGTMRLKPLEVSNIPSSVGLKNPITRFHRQRMHISHGLFWRGRDGEPPPPFTVITHADVQAGTWTPVDAAHKVSENIHQQRHSRNRVGVWNGSIRLSIPIVCYHDLLHQAYTETYLRKLEEGAGDRFQHTIWPEHCLVRVHLLLTLCLDTLRVGSAGKLSEGYKPTPRATHTHRSEAPATASCHPCSRVSPLSKTDYL